MKNKLKEFGFKIKIQLLELKILRKNLPKNIFAIKLKAKVN